MDQTAPLVKKACIIDDDKLYVSLLKMLVKKNQLAEELIVFENGKIALEYFKTELSKEQPDLPQVILLDLNMPIMDGWEFLEAIEPLTEELEARNLKLNVVSSTINQQEVKKVSSHAIVDSFMTKPISKDAMIKAFTANKLVDK